MLKKTGGQTNIHKLYISCANKWKEGQTDSHISYIVAALLEKSSANYSYESYQRKYL